MAKDTLSEKLVKIANLKYEQTRKARIHKKDPGLRLTKKGLIHASSSGLDYSGVIDGKHIEFEIKETKKDKLSLSDIRQSQIEEMEILEKTSSEVFLLVFFSVQKEWYRLDWPDLKRIVESEYRSIPIAYFQAFGFMIPFHQGWPRYLDPESHHQSNYLKSTYPSWMPTPRKRQSVTRIESPDHLDMDARRNRIMHAAERGAKSARRKQQQIEIIKQHKR